MLQHKFILILLICNWKWNKHYNFRNLFIRETWIFLKFINGLRASPIDPPVRRPGPSLVMELITWATGPYTQP